MTDPAAQEGFEKAARRLWIADFIIPIDRTGPVFSQLVPAPEELRRPHPHAMPGRLTKEVTRFRDTYRREHPLFG
jgi:hypothetical protein